MKKRKAHPMEYISLAQLLQDSPVYERLPQPIQAGLRHSVWLTLITQLALLIFLIFVEPGHHDAQSRLLHLHRSIHSSGFFLGPSADIAGSIVMFAYQAVPYVILLGLANLFLTLLVLTLSLWMVQSVHEPVHWLAAVNSVPAVINIFVVGAIAFLLAAIVVVLIIVWAVIIMVALSILFGVITGSIGNSE